MALFKTRGAAIYGIDAHLIDVEVDMFASGNARDSVMVGMPDVAVRESRERIKSALINSGFGYPNKRITINLAPANVRKEGAGFDLPVAIGILGAMGALTSADRHIFIGELSLDGAIRPVRGVLSIAVCAREQGIREPGGAGGECGRGGGSVGRECVWRALPGGGGGDARRGRANLRRRARRLTATARTSSPLPISATCAGRRWRSGRSKSRRRAFIMC